MMNPTIAERDQMIFKSSKMIKVSAELFLAKNEMPPIPNKALATRRDMSGSILFHPKNVKNNSGYKKRGIAIKKSTTKCTTNQFFNDVFLGIDIYL